MEEQNKDWTGNKRTTFATMGASNHVDFDRETNDYYATDPIAVRKLLSSEDFSGPIWECACGEGHLSKEIIALGYDVHSSDLIDRGYGTTPVDFLAVDTRSPGDYNIITNPPYKFANQFMMKGYSLLQPGRKLALFLPIRYLEGKERKAKIFDRFPPKTIHISSGRIVCALNGEFEKVSGSAMAFAWFVWQKDWEGETSVKWF